VGIFVPPAVNEWRRNLILVRNYHGVRDHNGDGLRNDDGASFYNHTNNVLYLGGNGLQFNGGTNIYSVNNLYIQTGWHLGPTPDVAGSFNDTWIDSPNGAINNGRNCEQFWNASMVGPGLKPAVYR
jgi:hypothetical protein